MAREIRVGQTTNADVYMNGNRHVGRIKSAKFDKIAYEKVSHSALGMVGKWDGPSRALEPIKFKVMFAWLDTESMLAGWSPTKALDLMFEKYVDVFDGDGLVTAEGYRVITQLSMLVSERSFEDFKNDKDGIGFEFDASVHRFSIKSTDTDVIIQEYDVFNGINRVNGADVWPRY